MIVNTKVFRDAQLEEELKELENPTPEPEVVDPPAQTPEEETWKKRHSDLRSYTSKQLNEKEKELAALKRQLEEQKKADPKLPENKEEAEKWVKDYPDLARVLMTLMEEKTELVKQDVRSVREELEMERIELQMEKALNKLLKAHPDFLELKETEKFQEWVAAQPAKRGPIIGQAIYDALYNNQTDADSAIEAVSLYKSENKPTKKDTSKEFASSVTRTTNQAPVDDNGKRIYKESEIDKMSHRDYDKYEEDIENARLEGRIVYDLTGATR